jgi:hypothetical protein
VRAQLFAEQSHQLAALRRGNEPPIEEGRMCLLDRRRCAAGVGLPYCATTSPVIGERAASVPP